MKKWKVPLPKVSPPEGCVSFAVAFKTDTGTRVELTNATCDRNKFLRFFESLRASSTRSHDE